jgi:hypothetical protein
MPSAAAAVPVPLSTLSARDVRGRALMLLAAAALAVAALLGAPAAPASATDGAIVLAVDGAELLGPDPMPRNAEDNPARDLGGYEDRDIPFTWGAAWLLTFLGFGGLATMGIVYWRAVDRPGRNRTSVRR